MLRLAVQISSNYYLSRYAQHLKSLLDDISEHFPRPPIIEDQDPDRERLIVQKRALATDIAQSEYEKMFQDTLAVDLETINAFYDGLLWLL